MLIQNFGSSNVFEPAEIAKPEVGPGPVLVKIAATSINTVDTMVAMINTTLDKKRARKIISIRMMKGMLDKLGLYHEFFPREFSYDLTDFDPAHFGCMRRS